jgi:hypothetical protein
MQNAERRSENVEKKLNGFCSEGGEGVFLCSRFIVLRSAFKNSCRGDGLAAGKSFSNAECRT